MLRRIAKAAGVALVVVLLLYIVKERSKTLYADVDRLTYDYVVDGVGLGNSNPDVIVVDFDEATFQRINKYPVPRTYFADAINRIAPGRPKIIGLDVFLDETRTPAEDEALATAIRNSGSVILASQASTPTTPVVMPLPMFCTPVEPELSSGDCTDNSPAAGYAFVGMPIDPDGFIRQAYLGAKNGSKNVYSFPMTLARFFVDADKDLRPDTPNDVLFNGHQTPYSNRDLGAFLIGTWAREPATRIPAWKLLSGQIPASAFRNKIVMIGQTSDAARDTDFTPLFREEGPDGVRLKMGGTAIHAAAVSTLLSGKGVWLTPDFQLYLSIFAFCTVAATCLLACDLSAGLGGLALIVLSALVLSLVLYANARIWFPLLPLEGALAVTLPLTLGLRFLEERFSARDHLQQREQLMKLFSSYVDPAVAETIWTRRTEVSLSGEEKTATVMFTDIRNFTALSSDQPPAVVLAWLNRYCVAMDEVIREHGGFLNKFIGDGLMIIFGLPLSRGAKRDARYAVKAALAMLARVETLNAEKPDDPDFPRLRIGVGIHTGSLVVGSIGSVTRQEYSVIGETVNLASRLESLNKSFGTELLMTETTMRHIEKEFPDVEYLGESPVKGLQEPIKLYTLRAAGPQSPPKV